MTVRKESGCLTIAVADTGIGMTAKEQSRLFQEFVRIKNDKTRDIPGTGLGLAIVKGIIDLYQGAIRVRSEPGRGTTISLMCKTG